jgi:hypothetical protein
MAKTPQSRKSKGRRFQQFIRDAILEKFPQLTERDVESTGMGQSGADIKLSQAAVEKFPYSVEAKNQETVSLWAWWRQTESNVDKDTKPLLVIKKNRQEPLAVLRFKDFMDLL